MTGRRGPGVRRGVAVLLAFSAALAPSFAAEAVKLRPRVAIYVGSDDGGLLAPAGVGCGAGLVAVADTGNGRILTFAFDADSVRPADTWTIPQVPVPLRIDVLSGGGFLVLDGRSRRIARIGSTGEFEGLLEPRGEDLGRVEARSLAVGPEDGVFVLDVAGDRVLVLDASGTFQRSISFPPRVGFTSDLTVDSRGDVYVVDSVKRSVYVARRGEDALTPLTSSLVEDLDFPTSIDVDADGRLYLGDKHGGGIVILGRDGSFRGRQLSMGWKEGLLRYPSGLCLDERGRLFVADTANNRVQMLEIR